MVKAAKPILLFVIILSSVIVCWSKPIDLQMGARAFGMGGAFAAIADDATAAYWNPAGLSQISSITFSETNWILADVNDVNVNYFNAVFPIPGIGTIAGGWLLQHALLEQGNGATFKETNWNEHSFSLTAGRQLWESLLIFKKTSVGFSLNRHIISAGADNGAGVGFDLGILTYFPYNFSLGLVAKSVATDMMGDKIDPEYRAGIGYTFIKSMHKVVVAADFQFKKGVEYEHGVKPVDDFLGGNHKGFLGLEYSFIYNAWFVSARGGANRMVNSVRENNVITGGLGGGYAGINVNYAFQTNTNESEHLGDTHRITIEFELDKLLKVVKKK